MLKKIMAVLLLVLLPFNTFAQVQELAVEKAKTYLQVREISK